MHLNTDAHHQYALDRQQRLRDEAAAHRRLPRRTRSRLARALNHTNGLVHLVRTLKEHTMTPRRTNRRRVAQRLLAGVVLAAAVSLAASGPARAATTASFSGGILTVFGDAGSNTITISRDAAGKILVNGGAVAVTGGTPTVANTSLIQVFGQAGNDTIGLNEANGALPRANLSGGATTTRSRAARPATSSSAREATTRSSAAAASTSSPAARRTTSSPAATPTIRSSARAATTGWSGTPATTPT